MFFMRLWPWKSQYNAIIREREMPTANYRSQRVDRNDAHVRVHVDVAHNGRIGHARFE